jgi:hypothetical protein
MTKWLASRKNELKDTPDINNICNQGKLFENAMHREFHGFGQAKFLDGGSVLGLSQFSILRQLPLKFMLDSKVVKINLKNNHH